MAVQLGRLSMWLATLAADRPLTFLDHRLRTGDSLVGAAPWDILRQPAPGSRSRARSSPLPLFEDDDLDRALGAAVAVRGELALGPGDTLEQVRAKERALAHLRTRRLRRSRDGSGSPTRGARSGFRRPPAARRAGPSFPDVMASIFQRPHCAAGAPAAAGDTAGEAAAAAHRFFHWPLEFPELFHDEQGRAARCAGLRRRPRQSALGDAARRPRHRAHARGRAARGIPRRRLRARIRHLPAAGRRPRQPVSAVRRARARAAAARTAGWVSSCRPASPSITAAPRCAARCSNARRSTRCTASRTATACSRFIAASSSC